MSGGTNKGRSRINNREAAFGLRDQVVRLHRMCAMYAEVCLNQAVMISVFLYLLALTPVYVLNFL